MTRNNADFAAGHGKISQRNPDYSFTLYDNVEVTHPSGWSGHGHEVSVWHNPTSQEVGKLSWWDEPHPQLGTPAGHIVEEQGNPEVVDAMHIYAANRHSRAKNSVLRRINSLPNRGI